MARARRPGWEGWDLPPFLPAAEGVPGEALDKSWGWGCSKCPKDGLMGAGPGPPRAGHC